MNSHEELENHPVFRNDPIQLLEMVHSHVELTTSDGSVHNGRVFTIDPVSERYVILQLVVHLSCQLICKSEQDT